MRLSEIARRTSVVLGASAAANAAAPLSRNLARSQREGDQSLAAMQPGAQHGAPVITERIVIQNEALWWAPRRSAVGVSILGSHGQQISILGAHTRVRDVGIVSHRGLWGSQGAATLTSSDAFSCSAVERVAMHDGPRSFELRSRLMSTLIS